MIFINLSAQLLGQLLVSRGGISEYLLRKKSLETTPLLLLEMDPQEEQPNPVAITTLASRVLPGRESVSSGIRTALGSLHSASGGGFLFQLFSFLTEEFNSIRL